MKELNTFAMGVGYFAIATFILIFGTAFFCILWNSMFSHLTDFHVNLLKKRNAELIKENEKIKEEMKNIIGEQK